MKNKTTEALDDDLRPHYDFDYSKAKPNRFAGMNLKFKNTPVYLDEDVSEVFQSSETVNTFLRSAIRAMRAAAPRKRAKRAAPKKRRAS